jgi:diguanylate cyclase (GGDEF)-like protein/PAS domain S-box-containing protein
MLAQNKSSRTSMASRPRTLNLFRFWLILLALNGIIAAIASHSLIASRERAIEQVRDNTSNLANLLSENIADSARSIDLSLQGIADALEYRAQAGELDAPMVESMLIRFAQRHPEVEAFRVSDENGVVRWGDPRRSGKPHSYADRDFFQRHKVDPGIGLLVSEPIHARLAKTWVVVFSRAYRHPDGSFAGVVRAGVPISHYTGMLAKLDLATQGSVVIRHINHALVTRYPPVDGPAGTTGDKTTSPQFRQILRSGVDSGMFHALKAPDGYERTYAFRRIANTQMVVNVGMSPQDYLATWQQELRNTLLFLALFFLVSVAAGWLVLRSWRRHQEAVGALQDSEARFRTVSSITSDLVYSCLHRSEAGFSFDWIGGDTTPLFGLDNQAMLALGCWCAVVVEADKALFHRNISHLKNGEGSDCVLRITRPDGVVRHVRSVARVEEDAGLLRLFGALQDITASVEAEEKLRQSELSFRSLFESLQEAVFVWGEDGRFLAVNAGAAQMYGRPVEWFVGKTLLDISPPDINDPSILVPICSKALAGERQTFEFRGQREDASVFPKEVHLSRGSWFGQNVVFTVETDITERKAHQEQLEQIAHYDTLTQLPNRMLLADRMKLAMAHCRRSGEILAVCMMDLDGFKPVNDSMGHKAGDAVLQEIARRLLDVIRADDTAARIGGDEFVLLLGGFKTVDQCHLALRRVLDSVALPFSYSGRGIRVSGSLGVTFYQGDATEADQLLRHADQAMYVAKERGKNRYHVFETAVELRLRANQGLYKRIETALERGQFCLYYQPKVDCRSGKIAGFEALIRWNHPTLGLRGPSEFIPLIEHDDLIIRVGEWVIGEALRQMTEWRQAGLETSVSVNVTVRQFVHGDFGQRMTALLATYPEVESERLEIELVETAALEDINAVSDVMAKQHAQGIHFSLDDFGTGYSSLVHLKRLAVDVLKIDQTFVRDMLIDPGDLAIVQGVIGLASAFHHKVVAEGVETTEQILMLLELGCDLMQGYGLSRPMPSDKVLDWVRDFQADPRWQLASKHFPSRSDFDLLLMEVGHRHWLEQICAENLAIDNVPPGYDACRFSQWCQDVGSKRFGALPAFLSLDRQHREVHRLAEALVGIRCSGTVEEVTVARQSLTQAGHQLLEDMHDLRMLLASVTTSAH